MFGDVSGVGTLVGTMVRPVFPRGTVSYEATNSVVDIANQYIASMRAQIASLSEQNQDLRQQLNLEREYGRTQADRITTLAADMAKLAEQRTTKPLEQAFFKRRQR